MTHKDIKDVFDIHASELVYDVKLIKRIAYFRHTWATKSQDYIEFLGGVLLGVKSVRFSVNDQSLLFDDTLDLDLKVLREELYKVKGINPNWKVSSDAINITMIYLMYRFINSKEITNADKEFVIKELYYILAYKMISSLIYKGFGKYPVTEAIAKATFERLSNRFLLKQVGSWQKFFEYRAKDILPSGVKYKAVEELDTDNVIMVLNDLQNRIRSTFKQIYSNMVSVINSDSERIESTSSTETSVDGDESNKDITNRPDKYITYLRGIVSHQNDFISNDVLTITATIMPNIDREQFVNILKFVSKHHEVLHTKKLDIISDIILSNINYLNDKKYSSNYVDNLLETMNALKNYWTSSRIVDPKVLAVKKELEKLVKGLIKKKSIWVITTNSIGLALYIFLRGIVRKHI